MSTNTQFNLEEGGEYRIVVIYLNGSVDRFYFNASENGLTPTAQVNDVDCGATGSITVNGVSSSYEFSINGGTTWQDSNFFTITSAGTYDLSVRRKNTPDACVFPINDVLVQNKDFNATATAVQSTCNNNKGEIVVDIADNSDNYIYKAFLGSSLVQSSGPVAQSNYTFTDLNPGNYTVEVTFANVSSCAFTSSVTLDAFYPHGA